MLAGPALYQVDLQALATFSFAESQRKPVHEVLRRYREMFGAADAAAVPAEVGTAHAYELVHLLGLAITRAGSIDRAAVRSSLEHVDHYAGLMRDYRPPFTPTRHEALSINDYRLIRYRVGAASAPAAR